MDLNEVFSKLALDVIGIEETKMSTDDPDKFPLKMDGYHFYETISKVKKGYSGVAVFSKKEPLSVHYGLIDGKYDEEGRAITLEFEDLYFVCLYVPNSGEGLKRLPFRMEFQKDLERYLAFLQAKKPVVLTGDLNVAKEDIDIKNPASNHQNAGFTDEEREAMRHLLSSCDMAPGTTAMRLRSRLSRAMGASTVPLSSRKLPTTMHSYVRASVWSASWAERNWCA